MYLDESAVGATLDFLRDHSGSGSAMVFDYMLSSVIEGKHEGLPGAARSALVVSFHGEPHTFGLTPAACAALVKRHRRVLISDMGWKTLTQRYLTANDGRMDGKMGPHYRIALVRAS